MKETSYIIKFTDQKHSGEYVSGFSESMQAYATSKLPSRAVRFDSWTEAQRIAFTLSIDTITDIIPLPTDYPTKFTF